MPGAGVIQEDMLTHVCGTLVGISGTAVGGAGGYWSGLCLHMATFSMGVLDFLHSGCLPQS